MFNKSHELYKKVKLRKFLFFKLDFSILVDNQRCVSQGKIQNFSSISQKLCLLGEKYTGTWAVNTTIVLTVGGHVSSTG